MCEMKCATESDPYARPPETPRMDMFIEPPTSHSVVSSSDDRATSVGPDLNVMSESRTSSTDAEVFRMPLSPSKRAKTVASAVSGDGIPPESVVVASERDDDFRGEDFRSPQQRVTTTQVDTIVNYSTPAEQLTRSNVVSPDPTASSSSPVPPSSSVVSDPSDPNVITHRVLSLWRHPISTRYLMSFTTSSATVPSLSDAFSQSLERAGVREGTVRDHRFIPSAVPDVYRSPGAVLGDSSIVPGFHHSPGPVSDFECMLSKVSSAAPNVQKSFTYALEKHIPLSYAMIVIDQDDKVIHHNYYVGTDAVEHFLKMAKDLAFRLIKKLKTVSEIELDDSSMYDSSKCVICHKKFKNNDKIVRHHLHHENVVAGKAHQMCNLQYKKTFFIPVVIHNSKNYDSHLLFQYLPKEYASDISIIPINLEKISMFTLDHLKFLDSFQFLDSSLDTLIENLIVSNHEFKMFNNFFQNNKNKYLLYRKGIFPYSYVDNIDKLQTKSLPSREAFFNVLTRQHISEKDYIHALAVFRAFDCKTFGDYLQLYQNTDVLMLAEVFCAFRTQSLKYYELDPVHYISVSELTFDAGLKFCKIELQLLGNINDYIWLEIQMRGEICLVSKRYAKANNPFLVSDYDPSQAHSYILALDIVNLYGHATSQFLPMAVVIGYL
ncbi:hypothetical protein AVEN_192279-1 [Araneus ventricosus]|uniref:C2H2-type domain-containing protein n=1 Tax=Araneus ventricosus TaxID=182803 RepID=A0A4Y2TUY7_ARAVE|nr:hypothetical protein AVEN_192279-1 [Araneus ventricosus]